jgi:hypothetical protein
VRAVAEWFTADGSRTSSLEALAGQAIRLRLRAVSTKLYSLQFEQ